MTNPAQTRARRVLVVDDAAADRRILGRLISALPDTELVSAVGDLASARAVLTRERVDAVTLDVNLREESGLDLLRWMRVNKPAVTTVLVTSGSEKGARTEVDALLLGASALVLKPQGAQPHDQFAAQLARSLLSVERGAANSPPPKPIAAPKAPVAAPRELIVVGASTGGPPAVLTFLKSLPKEFAPPICVVQHMPAPHLGFFAEQLASQSGRPVRLARDGEPALAGVVYLAPGARHLRVGRLGKRVILLLDDGPEEHFCKPALDPLFRSTAQVCGAACAGVVMSGMGKDGALGAEALHQAGAPVAVQDEASCVVFSMPAAAIAKGAVCAVAPPAELANHVARWTARAQIEVRS